MTTAHLLSDLQRDESYAEALDDGTCRAYPDPLTGATPWTIGFGHTGLEVHPALVWTRQQALDALDADINCAVAELDVYLPWWRKMDDLRQDVLANMCFNMGIGKLEGFTHTLASMKAKDYVAAAREMLESHWASQVGARATRLSEQMRTGEHQP